MNMVIYFDTPERYLFVMNNLNKYPIEAFKTELFFSQFDFINKPLSPPLP